MAAAPAYVRHRPEDTVLYAVVEEHAEAFFSQMEEQGASMPVFVHREFERYLRSGRLEEGVVRVGCTGCRHEHLVAFSCKCRGFCPSCGARRMVESAAGPLRLLFAARPELLTRVLAVVTRALSTALARRAGLRASDAETGLVTFIQRFGSALNLNVHLHVLALDGAYTFDGERPRFHRVPPPPPVELERLLDTLIRRITRALVRSGALMARLAALVPRPRSHLIRFHGLFAPNARHRRLVVPAPTPAPGSDRGEPMARPTHVQMRLERSACAEYSISTSASAHVAVQHCACWR